MIPEPVIPSNYNDVTFELEIISMSTVDESNPDTVSKVKYILTGTQGGRSASHSRTLNLDTENIESFINYTDLTKDVVKSWIETLSNYLLDKYSVCNVILDQVNRESNTKALPWE